LPLAFRMTLRDARAGELRLIGLALLVAVAAVTSVAFLSGRVGAALERDAARMLGADLVLESGLPVAGEIAVEAHRRGLSTVRVWQFPSMAAADNVVQLAAVKAVEPGYPLRGVLRTAPTLDADDAPAGGVPERGTVWVDAPLLSMLNIDVGGTIALGETDLHVTRVISDEPDRGMQFVNAAPRVMMHAEDLPATGLLGPGSRVGHVLQVAGEDDAVRGFRAWLDERREKGLRIADLASGRPEVRRAVDRAQRFLALVALLTVMVSAVAVALAARRYVHRHRDATAIMRCLGATRRLVMHVLTVEFALIALVGAAAGSGLGWLMHRVLIVMLDGLIGVDLPGVSAVPALQGLATGIWLLMGFALPPLSQLQHVPPARVLRRDATGLHVGGVAAHLWTVPGFALLLVWFAHDLRLGVVVSLGFVGAFAVFAAVAALLLAVLARLRSAASSGLTLRFALAGLVRRRGATLAQICAMAMGIMALTLLTVTRTDLLDGWQRTLPADAPNRFLINIQPDQRDALRGRLAQAGLGDVRLYPMIRGRLLAINGRDVKLDDVESPRARQLLDRDFNLSYADGVPHWNRIIAGRNLNPDASEVSLETGLAQALGLSLGDSLRFDVEGRMVEVNVTSIRQVDWGGMQVNFFALATPAALASFQQSWITSFYLPDAQAHWGQTLVREFPNLTLFDVRIMIGQVQRVLDQAVGAVQGLFVFTLAAGALVLAAALASTRDERVHEAAVLRALGATRSQLARAQRLELLLTGALAGLLGAAGASAVAWALANYVFEFALGGYVWPWIAAPAAGMLTAWGAGALTLRGVLHTPPWVTLREI